MTRRATRGWFLRRLRARGGRWVLGWHHRAVGPMPGPEAPTARAGPVYLPAGPLVAVVARYGGPRLAAAALASGLSEAALRNLDRAYHRAAGAGSVTLHAADELAVRLLGVHPCVVWGEDWWDAIA